LRLVETRHFRAQAQLGPAYLEAFRVSLQRDGRFRTELGRREPGGLKLKRQRHCEASSMGGRNQLFGIGTVLVLESSFERVRRICKYM